MSPIERNPYGDSIRVITLSNSSSKVAKNGKNDVFSSYFSNHYCTKLKLVPTKLGIHNPLKTCLEYDPMRAAFKKKNYGPKNSGQNVKISCDFGIF